MGKEGPSFFSQNIRGIQDFYHTLLCDMGILYKPMGYYITGIIKGDTPDILMLRSIQNTFLFQNNGHFCTGYDICFPMSSEIHKIIFNMTNK